MRAPRALLALGVLLGVLLTSSPAGAEASALAVSSPLQVNLPQPIIGCDPVGHSIPAATMQVLSLVLPSVTVTSSRGTVQQASSFVSQAEVQSLSPFVVSYTIKKQARWSDGSPITVLDFAATWRIGAAGTGPSANEYRMIQSITSDPGSENVVVAFKAKTNAWLSLFSPLLPATVNSTALASCPVPSASIDMSAGPYVIVSANATQVVLGRNPTWWGSPSAFDPLVINGGLPLASAPSVGVGQLAMSQASWLSPQTLAVVTSNPAASSSLDSSNRLVSLDFAVSGSGGLSLGVRRGIAGLLDRSALVTATAGAILPATRPATSHLISQGLPNYPSAESVPSLESVTTTSTTTTHASVSTIPPRETTTTTSPFYEAERLLGAAGFHQADGRWLSATGEPLSLSLAVPTDDQWAIDVAWNVALQLKQQGVGVQLIPAAGSFEIAQCLQRGLCNAGVIVRTTDAFPAHAATWFSVQRGLMASPLWAGVNDRTLNRMVRDASKEMNAQNAAPLYQAIDQRLWDLMPSLPLLTEPAALVWSSVIDGISLNPYPPGTVQAITTWKLLPAAP